MLEAFRDRAENVEAVIRTYLNVLSDLPAGCVVDACLRFSRGQVPGHNMAFPPNAPQVHQEADRLRTEKMEHDRLTRPRPELPAIEGPPMKPIERGYHPSWDLLAAKPIDGKWLAIGDGKDWEKAQ